MPPQASKAQLDRLHAVTRTGRSRGSHRRRRPDELGHRLRGHVADAVGCSPLIGAAITFAVVPSHRKSAPPLKANVLNVLSPSAASGWALVCVSGGPPKRHHADRHHGSQHPGADVLRRLRPASMDYRLPLARIREFWLSSAAAGSRHRGCKTRRQLKRAWRWTGPARDGGDGGGALIMAIAFAALDCRSNLLHADLRPGLTTLAILVDATLVRMALLPGFHAGDGSTELQGAGATGATARAHRADRGAGRSPCRKRRTAGYRGREQAAERLNTIRSSRGCGR